MLPIIRNHKKPLFPNYDDAFYIVSNAYPSLGIYPSEVTKQNYNNNGNNSNIIANNNINNNNITQRPSFIESKNKGQLDFNQVFNKLCRQNNVYSFNQKVDFYVENEKMMRKTIAERDQFGKTLKFGKYKSMSVDLNRLAVNNTYNINETREVLITTPNSLFGTKKRFTIKTVINLFKYFYSCPYLLE